MHATSLRRLVEKAMVGIQPNTLAGTKLHVHCIEFFRVVRAEHYVKCRINIAHALCRNKGVSVDPDCYLLLAIRKCHLHHI